MREARVQESQKKKNNFFPLQNLGQPGNFLEGVWFSIITVAEIKWSPQLTAAVHTNQLHSKTAQFPCQCPLCQRRKSKSLIVFLL